MAKATFNEVDEFCWQLRDGINWLCLLPEQKRKKALHKMIKEKQWSPRHQWDGQKSRASKHGQVWRNNECKRQLFDVVTHKVHGRG